MEKKRDYSERIRLGGVGGRGARSRVVETASDVGFRQSPRVSDDGAISLPAIPARRRGSKKEVGGTVWKNAAPTPGITSEMLTAHEREERRAQERRERRERSDDVVRRRREVRRCEERGAKRRQERSDDRILLQRNH